MQRHRELALGAYLVGAMLILLPLLDAGISISPPRFGDVRWRFGASAMLANALLIPNAGLLLMLITAINFGHTTFRRLLGVAALVGVVIWVAAIGMFALDSIQTRPTVRPEMSTSFAVASWSAVGKMIASTVTLLVLGLIGFRGAPGREVKQDAATLFVVDHGPPVGGAR